MPFEQIKSKPQNQGFKSNFFYRRVRCESSTQILLNWLPDILESQFQRSHDNENLKLKFINMLLWQNTRPFNGKIWRGRLLVSKDLSLSLKLNIKRPFVNLQQLK